MIAILNTEKIINSLKEHKRPISIKRLAEESKINTKYIGKYLKILEADNIIIRKRSENDKRVMLISLLVKKTLYFFKFGNLYLLHTRTSLEKWAFSRLYKTKNKEKRFSLIWSIKRPIFIENEYEIMKLNGDDYDETNYSQYHTPKSDIQENNEHFYYFDNRVKLLEEYYDYNVHIYSKKEVRELRKKKAKTSLYSSIVFNHVGKFGQTRN